MVLSPALAELRWTAYRAINRLSRLVDPYGDPASRVMFLHLPKCGGTSVDWAIRRPRGIFAGHIDFDGEVSVTRAIQGEAYDYSSNLLWHNAQTASLRLLHYGAPVVSGHFPFHAQSHPIYAERYHFVTLLREPVARWISHYRYIKMGAYYHLGENVASVLADEKRTLREQLDWLLDSQVGWFLGSLQAALLGGYGLYDSVRTDADRSALAERATAALERFTVVGTLERLDRFEADMRASAGPMRPIAKRNATDEKPTARANGRVEVERRRAHFEQLQAQDKQVKALFDAPTRERIRERCAADLLLLDNARRARGL